MNISGLSIKILWEIEWLIFRSMQTVEVAIISIIFQYLFVKLKYIFLKFTILECL